MPGMCRRTSMLSARARYAHNSYLFSRELCAGPKTGSCFFSYFHKHLNNSRHDCRYRQPASHHCCCVSPGIVQAAKCSAKMEIFAFILAFALLGGSSRFAALGHNHQPCIANRAISFANIFGGFFRMLFPLMRRECVRLCARVTKVLCEEFEMYEFIREIRHDGCETLKSGNGMKKVKLTPFSSFARNYFYMRLWPFDVPCYLLFSSL